MDILPTRLPSERTLALCAPFCLVAAARPDVTGPSPRSQGVPVS